MPRSTVVGSIATDAQFVRRRPGQWQDGRWQPGPEVVSTVSVVFSPMGRTRDETGRIRAEKIVGVRIEDSARVVVQRLTVMPSAGRDDTGPDLIRHQGQDWQVHSVLLWDDRNMTAEVVVVRARAAGAWTPPTGAISPSSEAVQRAVQALVAEGSQVPLANVISARQSAAPEMSGLWAQVMRVSEANLSRPATNHASQQDDQYTLDSVTYAVVRSFWDATWIGPGALDSCQRFRLWIRSPAGQEATSGQGLTYERVGMARDYSALIQDSWEERAGLDLGFRYVQSFRFTTPAMAVFRLATRISLDGQDGGLYGSEVDATQPRPS